MHTTSGFFPVINVVYVRTQCKFLNNERRSRFCKVFMIKLNMFVSVKNLLKKYNISVFKPTLIYGPGLSLFSFRIRLVLKVWIKLVKNTIFSL